MSVESNQPKKFYNLTIQERLDQLIREGHLSEVDAEILDSTAGLTPNIADHMIENVIGTFSLPMGVARNFRVNGRDIPIPMAVEEPSIVAGASFMAKLASNTGGFFAHTTAPEMIGQIQLLDLDDPPSARMKILAHKDELLAEAAEVDSILMALGGGPKDLEVRLIERSPIGPFLVVHIIYDVRDAMGANAVNTAVEQLTHTIESITKGRVHLRILSNLADRRLARARVTICAQDLAFDDFTGEEVRDGIIEAWSFAVADPYRAATHNKGIMNGVDPIVIATGNDWRAIEAGAHAYAARSGTYSSLSTWGKNADGNLVGTLEMPMAVGTVGGATHVHPAAEANLRMMGIQSASELAEVIVSVGLAQNLAALRALATEGIQRGHMSLHARQVAIAAGAEGPQIDQLAARLVAEKNIRVDRAREIFAEWSRK